MTPGYPGAEEEAPRKHQRAHRRPPDGVDAVELPAPSGPGQEAGEEDREHAQLGEGEEGWQDRDDWTRPRCVRDAVSALG